MSTSHFTKPANEDTTDFKHYQAGSTLWQPTPTFPAPGIWRAPSEQCGRIPEPLYRLRLSVSKDGVSIIGDLPTRMFVYPSLSSLEAAIAKLSSAFDGEFPVCSLHRGGVIKDSSTNQMMNATSAEMDEEEMVVGADDGRTEDMVLAFQKLNAREEDWEEFLAKLELIEGEWTGDKGEA